MLVLNTTSRPEWSLEKTSDVKWPWEYIGQAWNYSDSAIAVLNLLPIGLVTFKKNKWYNMISMGEADQNTSFVDQLKLKRKWYEE